MVALQCGVDPASKNLEHYWMTATLDDGHD